MKLQSPRRLLFFLAAASLAAASASASDIYVTTDYQQFGVVDLSTGAFAPIGPGTPEPDYGLVPGPNGTFYSVSAVSGTLVSINPNTGATTVIGATGVGSNVLNLASLNGKLYLTDISNNLYSVNPATGHATKIAATGIPPDAAPPGTVNPDGTIDYCDENLLGLNGKLYATYDEFHLDPSTNAETFVHEPNLWSIDPTTGHATLIDPTTINLSGLVNVSGQFDVFLGLPTNVSELETLNLTNGNTTFVRDVDPAAGLIFGAAAVPEPASMALTGFGLCCAAFLLRRRRRGTGLEVD